MAFGPLRVLSACGEGEGEGSLLSSLSALDMLSWEQKRYYSVLLHTFVRYKVPLLSYSPAPCSLNTLFWIYFFVSGSSRHHDVVILQTQYKGNIGHPFVAPTSFIISVVLSLCFQKVFSFVVHIKFIFMVVTNLKFLCVDRVHIIKKGFHRNSYLCLMAE